MKIIFPRLMLVIAMALAASAGGALAADAQKPATVRSPGGMQFAVPDGWQSGEQNGSIVLTPSDVPQDHHVVLMAPPAPAIQDSLEAWFDRAWKKCSADHKILAGGKPVHKPAQDKRVETVAVTAALQDKDGQALYITMFAASVHDRAQWMVFMSDDGALFKKYTPALQTLLGTVRFVEPTDKPAAPVDAKGPAKPDAPAAKGEVRGLYMGPPKAIFYNSTPILNPYGPNNTLGYLDNYLYFLPDGVVISKVPAQGMAGFDLKAYQQTHARFCGTYRQTGDRIHVEWAEAKPEDGTIDPKDGRIAFTGAHGKPWRSLPGCESVKLRGKFIDCTMTDAATQWITFTPEGAFQASNLLGSKSNTSGSGTYATGQNTIQLKFDDGRVLNLFFWVSSSDIGKDPIDAVALAGRLMELRPRKK